MCALDYFVNSIFVREIVPTLSIPVCSCKRVGSRGQVRAEVAEAGFYCQPDWPSGLPPSGIGGVGFLLWCASSGFGRPPSPRLRLGRPLWGWALFPLGRLPGGWRPFRFGYQACPSRVLAPSESPPAQKCCV
eukprot:5637774-Amphidinium_carterae.1